MSMQEDFYEGENNNKEGEKDLTTTSSTKVKVTNGCKGYYY